MIDQIYQLLKTDPTYSWMSDKEKWIYLQISEIKDKNKTDAELCQICGQRSSMLNKFVAELRAKKLYPVPVTVLPQKLIPVPSINFQSKNPFAPPYPQWKESIPTVPHCEVCGLEGKIAAQRGRPVMHGIELFQEDGRIMCATCRTKLINPKHGTEERVQIEDEDDDEEL